MKENDIIARITDELTDKFSQNGWKPVTLTMEPSGATLKITPCFTDERNHEHAAFFLCDTPAMNMSGCGNIQELARAVNDFEKNRLESLGSKCACKAYYEKHIRPYSEDDIRRSSAYLDIIHEAWNKSDKSGIYDFIRDFSFADIAMDGDSPERAEELVRLGLHHEFYSDWYKELYGRRP